MFYNAYLYINGTSLKPCNIIPFYIYNQIYVVDIFKDLTSTGGGIELLSSYPPSPPQMRQTQTHSRRKCTVSRQHLWQKRTSVRITSSLGSRDGRDTCAPQESRWNTEAGWPARRSSRRRPGTNQSAQRGESRSRPPSSSC